MAIACHNVYMVDRENNGTGSRKMTKLGRYESRYVVTASESPTEFTTLLSTNDRAAAIECRDRDRSNERIQYKTISAWDRAANESVA